MQINGKRIKAMYINKPADYYASQCNSTGMRSAWFRKRQQIAGELAHKYYKGKGIVLDVGCGNCLWNKEHIPTIGIDICQSMLLYDKKNIDVFIPLKADIYQGLPIKDEQFDMIIITEVLEHMKDYTNLINEMNRVLKPGGILIGSVPYSMLPGLWGIIFPLWCKYKGWKYNDEYYRNRCGHVVKFNRNKIKNSFKQFIFLESVNFLFLTLFFVAKKS